MVLTTQQIHELNKMPLTELKTVHRELKKHSKKATKKEDLAAQISAIAQRFCKLRCELSAKYNCTIKPYPEKDISGMIASDLRQIHASFRHALQCKSYTKQNIIRSFEKLARQVDYFIQY